MFLPDVCLIHQEVWPHSQQKAVRGHYDPYLVLFDYRNTHAEVGSSLAQKLFSRRTPNLSPLSGKQLEPETVHLQDVQQKLIGSKQRQAFYYDQKGTALPELQPGQTVRMKKPNASTWSQAVFKEMIGPRSHVVESDG